MPRFYHFRHIAYANDISTFCCNQNGKSRDRPFKKRDKFKRNSKCLIIVSMRMYSRSNAAYLKSSIDRRKLLIPLNITYCLPAFPTAPTNSFIAKSMLESDSASALFRFDISFLFFVVISVGDRLSVIAVSYCRSL